MKNDLPSLPVAVIGAGPVGLAAAAHLLERGFSPVVLEAGAGVASHLRGYGHVQLFSPWRYDIDPAARRLLEAAGWAAPPDDVLPTAADMVERYLEPLAKLPAMAGAIRYSHRVLAISREGFDKVKSKGRDDAAFVIRAETPGGTRELRAWAVLDASGTWGRPNPLGANGLPALGEAEAAARIAYGMPDILGRERERYAGKRVLVAGAGHSAAGNLLALAKLAEQVPGTRIAWTVRGRNFARIFGGGEDDALAARGALGRRLQTLAESGRLEIHADFRTEAIHPGAHGLTVEGRGSDGSPRRIEGIDEIAVAAGARPDLTLSSELRVKLDPWLESTEALAPLIDPNEHSCGTVRPHGHRELAQPEARFYAIGAKSYGRAPNFLMATGYEQARSVVAALAGDLAAADDVQLDLPRTGVCSTQFDEASSGCCVKDAEAKDEGLAGCGCPKPAAAPIAPARATACCR
ncbi:MAG TPA: NAD(P)-binding domain-containing protein [Usitatibacter sp.]|nr:NAD(P)-binding domain-containing protein [Usitatibacter sp.]